MQNIEAHARQIHNTFDATKYKHLMYALVQARTEEAFLKCDKDCWEFYETLPHGLKQKMQNFHYFLHREGQRNYAVFRKPGGPGSNLAESGHSSSQRLCGINISPELAMKKDCAQMIGQKVSLEQWMQQEMKRSTYQSKTTFAIYDEREQREQEDYGHQLAQDMLNAVDKAYHMAGRGGDPSLTRSHRPDKRHSSGKRARRDQAQSHSANASHATTSSEPASSQRQW